MRSAVNVARLPQSVVPDNRTSLALMGSIAGNIKQGLDKRKASKLTDELLNQASSNVGAQQQEQPPMSLEERQGQMALSQVDIAEEQQLAETQQMAKKKREEVQRMTTWKTLTADPESAKGFMELQKLDPNAARTVANVLVSRDEQQIAGLQEQALSANRFNHNLGLMAIDDSVSDAAVRDLIKGRAKQLIEQGAPYEQLAPLMGMNREDIISHTRQQMLLSGQVHKIVESANPIILSDGQTAFNSDGTVFAQNEKSAAPMSEYQRASLDMEQKKLAASNDPNRAKLSDIKGINNDVSKLVKPVSEIHSAAKSLESLQEKGSSTDKVAAVFKFMKTLDPTSTVRESELEMVASSGGPFASIAGYLLQAQGEGGMTNEIFRNIVDTSKGLANSAIGSASNEISSYLNVYDEISDDRKQKLMGRIPAQFESSQQDQPPMTATNPNTGQRIISTDGGQTWQEG